MYPTTRLTDDTIMQIKTEWLETFLAVVDQGGFTAATRRTHRTQSAISLQIRKLEEAVGARLLERNARAVKLTARGELLLPYARRVAAAVDEAALAMQAPEAAESLRLGIPEEYAEGVLSELLGAFRRTHPDVALEVVCAGTPELERRLDSSALDLALVLGEESQRMGEPLGRDQIVWATSRGRPLADVSPLPVALFDYDCCWRRWALDALDAGGVDYRIVFSSANVTGVRAAVGAGVAVGALARGTLGAGLRPVGSSLGLGALPDSSLMLIAGDHGRSQAARTFRDLLSSRLTDGMS